MLLQNYLSPVLILVIWKATGQIHQLPSHLKQNVYTGYSPFPTAVQEDIRDYKQNMRPGGHYIPSHNTKLQINKQYGSDYNRNLKPIRQYGLDYERNPQSSGSSGPNYISKYTNEQYKLDDDRKLQSKYQYSLHNNRNLQVKQQFGSEYSIKPQSNGQFESDYKYSSNFNGQTYKGNSHFNEHHTSIHKNNPFVSSTNDSFLHFIKGSNRPLDTLFEQHKIGVHHIGVHSSLKPGIKQPQHSPIQHYESVQGTFTGPQGFQNNGQSQERPIYTIPHQGTHDSSNVAEMTQPQLSKNIIFPTREDSEHTKDNDDRPKYSVPPGQPLQTIDSNPQLPLYSNLKYQSTLPSSATYNHWKGSQSLPENLHLYAESDTFPGQLDLPSRNVHLPEYEFGFVPLYNEKFTRNRNAPKSETPLASQGSTKIQSYLLSEKGPLSSQSQFNYLTTSKRLVLDCGSSNQIDWCDLGEQYPRSEVNYVIQQCLDTISRMYVEIPTNLEDLRESERLDYFYNYSENGQDQWKWTRHSFHKEALCESNQRFVYPSFARDSTGSWNVIVQAEEFPQRVPVEFCRVQGGPCSKIATCGLVSRCVQKYNYQLLISIDPAKPDVCPTMKLYKFPSACLCHAQIEKPAG